ncbi:MAG: hypothetical protein EOO13_14855 [Chitinophagaceae bacterium]|nr:MAG: hypothetical protein EOO13_14855 [Chitinophagaceae bacterium]
MQQVTVEFKEEVPLQELKDLSNVSNATKLSGYSFQLSTTDPEAVKKQLLQLSIEKNWNIVSLQSQSQSLENVFRSLTQ